MRTTILLAFLALFNTTTIWAQENYDKKKIKISYDKQGEHHVIEEDFYGDVPLHIQKQLDALQTSEVQNFEMDIIEYDPKGLEAKSVHIETDDEKNEFNIATKEKGKENFSMNNSFKKDGKFNMNFSTDEGDDIEISWDKGKILIQDHKGQEEILDLTSLHEFVNNLIEDSEEQPSHHHDDHNNTPYQAYKSDNDDADSKNHTDNKIYDHSGLERIKASKKSFGQELTTIVITSIQEGLQVKFSFNNTTATTINLYNQSGVAYYSEEIRTFSGNHSSVIPYNMKPGTYTLSIEQGNKAYFKEVIIPN